MQHFKSKWTVLLFMTVALASWKWEVLLILLGAEICSQSLHESIHHPNGRFAHPVFRILGILLAGVSAWLLV